MIQLPENYMDTIRVLPASKVLFMHFKNDANQYFTYYYNFADGAQNLELAFEQLKMLNLQEEKAYVLSDDLAMVNQEPRDQNWVVAPLPTLDMMSLAQYQAMRSVDA